MVSGHKNKHRQTRQELNEKRRLRRAKKALDAEAKGLRKRRLNLRTRELLHKANGKPLAKEMLEAAMIRMMALSLHYLPHDAQGNQRYREGEDGKKIPIGDYDRYIECTEAYARFAAWLAPYQSPNRPCHAKARCSGPGYGYQYASGVPSIPQASSARSGMGGPRKSSMSR